MRFAVRDVPFGELIDLVADLGLRLGSHHHGEPVEDRRIEHHLLGQNPVSYDAYHPLLNRPEKAVFLLLARLRAA